MIDPHIPHLGMVFSRSNGVKTYRDSYGHRAFTSRIDSRRSSYGYLALHGLSRSARGQLMAARASSWLLGQKLLSLSPESLVFLRARAQRALPRGPSSSSPYGLTFDSRHRRSQPRLMQSGKEVSSQTGVCTRSSSLFMTRDSTLPSRHLHEYTN